MIEESTLTPDAATYRKTVLAGDYWMHVVNRGETLRIVDLEGNQAVDTLFYSARNPRERYDVQRTLRKQNRVYLTTGTVLWSNLGNPMLTLVADTCGRHDTLGGACAQESNTVRYALEKRYMHSCRDNFLRELARYGMGPRDMVANLNFFMYVPVAKDGAMDMGPSISKPGDYVELRAEMDVLAVVSNCPQMNNPVNDYNPTPVRAIVYGD